MSREGDDGASLADLEWAIELLTTRCRVRWDRLYGLHALRQKYFDNQRQLHPAADYLELKQMLPCDAEVKSPKAARQSLWPIPIELPWDPELIHEDQMICLGDCGVNWSEYALPDQLTEKSEAVRRRIERGDLAVEEASAEPERNAPVVENAEAPLLNSSDGEARSSGFFSTFSTFLRRRHDQAHTLLHGRPILSADHTPFGGHPSSPRPRCLSCCEAHQTIDTTRKAAQHLLLPPTLPFDRDCPPPHFISQKSHSSPHAIEEPATAPKHRLDRPGTIHAVARPSRHAPPPARLLLLAMSLPSLIPFPRVDPNELPSLLPWGLLYSVVFPYSDLFSHIVDTSNQCPRWTIALEAFWETIHPFAWLHLGRDDREDEVAIANLRRRICKLERQQLREEADGGASLIDLRTGVQLLMERRRIRWERLFGLDAVRQIYLRHKRPFFFMYADPQIMAATLKPAEYAPPNAPRHSLWPVPVALPDGVCASNMIFWWDGVDWDEYALPDHPTEESDAALLALEAKERAPTTTKEEADTTMRVMKDNTTCRARSSGIVPTITSLSRRNNYARLGNVRLSSTSRTDLTASRPPFSRFHLNKQARSSLLTPSLSPFFLLASAVAPPFPSSCPPSGSLCSDFDERTPGRNSHPSAPLPLTAPGYIALNLAEPAR
ncbi:Serine/arginine repetitive matrix 1 [Rhodotorula toruloides ATCC 204091]|uniref:Serine/arginine repetitive matrix 1 n=1 Tax=Rhodotorula toruloides TaxID=5286 RepID=A0A0K3CHX5_RHOTO|nr:Serine/arginine repetitive matrix 1 [Rhodotorula toruloides ATCC 204091]PRQ73251.1 Serine/arginine repetitive matrix 1 [Rhodotorula toruloides]